MPENFRCGFVAIVGRPNVGKSTLLNQLVREKISITSPVAQTTLRAARAVLSRADYQMIFVDTPGINVPRVALGKRLIRSAHNQSHDADVIAMVIEVQRGVTKNDRTLFAGLEVGSTPVCWVLNKSDIASDAQVASARHSVSDIGEFPVVETSAVAGSGVELLRETLADLLPVGEALFPVDATNESSVTDQISEIVRERILLTTFQEVPHSVAVEVSEMFHREDGLMVVSVVIFVERESQKGIVVGKHGHGIKSIGQTSRRAIERILGEHIFLDLRVKVRKDWRRSEDMIDRFGYGN